MKTVNSSGNYGCVKIRHKGKYIRVKLIDPEPGWMRIFRKPNGKYVAKPVMDAPEDWQFIKSFFHMISMANLMTLTKNVSQLT